MNLQVFFQITIEVQVNILEALNFYVILCGQLVANPPVPAGKRTGIDYRTTG